MEKRLKSINSQAPVQRCTKAEVSPDWVLDIGAFDLKRVIEMDPEFLNTDGEMQPRDAAPRCGPEMLAG